MSIDIHVVNETVKSITSDMDDLSFSEHIGLCHNALSGVLESYSLIKACSPDNPDYYNSDEIKHGLALSLVFSLDILNNNNISLKRLEGKYNKSINTTPIKSSEQFVESFTDIPDWIAWCHYLVSQSYYCFLFEIGPKHNNWSSGIYRNILTICNMLEKFNIDIAENIDSMIENANFIKNTGWHIE